ncbi:tetratricopeptide repeat protein [Microbaculum marinisediminis]|uniref:Sel1 repeat family protein n=1 Tax=Microbaculum marinisediminis TaxID=2931392 RepID=A0AAW5QWG3_9HYPH|nr:tetratricopeptide repeat protein [Microbaculum sp. A6E488]MCT8971859.1 sel1 repeat family protein [Microbaculum sp. A6E488]
MTVLKLSLAVAVLALSAVSVEAGPFEDGLAAMDRADLSAARGYLEKAAKAGHAEAQYQLALLLMRGQGGSRDPEGARTWLEQAARSGHANAQYQLGEMLLWESDDETSAAAAAKAFEQAARLKHARAAYELAMLHAKGKGVAKDDVKAFDLYSKAAEGGVLEAEHIVGSTLVAGRHVEQDVVTGGAWLKLAQSGGDREAGDEWRTLLPTLTRQQRDAIQAILDNHSDRGYVIGADHTHPPVHTVD